MKEKGTPRFRVGIYIHSSIRLDMWVVPIAEREVVWLAPIMVEVK